MESHLENVLKNLVRIGTVSAVDSGNHKARVIFKDRDNLPSGWLTVLQHSGAAVDLPSDGGHAHTVSGVGSTDTQPGHNHAGTMVEGWMPSVEQSVLCLYLPMENGDGFIIGGL